jgi:hypothetical protein
MGERVQTEIIETLEAEEPLRYTPTDEITGLPLLIAPQDDVPYLLKHSGINATRRAAGRRDYIDRNHVYHPSTSLLTEDERALQGSRIQYVLRYDHDAYHAAYFGPPIPQTAAEQYYQMVFSAANYIPRRALDFSSDSPVEVTLTDEQLLRYQTSGEVKVADTKRVAKFLEDYVLADPEFSHIPVSLIDEFLTMSPESDDDLRRQRYLAHQLLSFVIDATTEPIYQAYKRALESNIWKPALNTSPRRVVHDQIIGRGQYRRNSAIRKVGGVLFDRLATYRGMEVAGAAA